MSILLESLEKKEPEASGQVPDVHASHFDDEMLGDEWLLTRVRNWRLAAIGLMILLVASWAYFIFSSSAQVAEQRKPKLLSGEKQQQTQESIIQDNVIASKEIATQGNSKETKIETDDTQPANTSKVEIADESTKPKVVYQPKKREIEKSTTRTSKQSTTSNNATSKTVAPSKSQSPAIFIEDLPANIQADFPSIELGSYVVSDDVNNSFVILDGGFYKVNQVIAPEMILREINKQHILVEFKGYFVKLPHRQ